LILERLSPADIKAMATPVLSLSKDPAPKPKTSPEAGVIRWQVKAVLDMSEQN
jgi:hypothetical protein